MKSQGWVLQSLQGLAPSFTRDSLVTPYFFLSALILRPFGSYLVEGSIGFIHQGFEELWLRDSAREPKRQGFGAGLHIANLKEIRGKDYLPSNPPFSEKVQAFSAEIAGVLSKMPSDERQLISAFKDNKLYGFPVDWFAGYSHRKKFEALREYVEQLSRSANLQ